MNSLEDLNIKTGPKIMGPMSYSYMPQASLVTDKDLQTLARAEDWDTLRRILKDNQAPPNVYSLDTIAELKSREYLSGNNTRDDPIIGYVIENGTIHAGSPELLGPWLSESQNWIIVPLKGTDEFREIKSYESVAGGWVPHWKNKIPTKTRIGSWSNMHNDPNLIELTKTDWKNQIVLALVQTKDPSASRRKAYPLEVMSSSIEEIIMITANKTRRPIRGAPPSLLNVHPELMNTTRMILQSGKQNPQVYTDLQQIGFTPVDAAAIMVWAQKGEPAGNASKRPRQDDAASHPTAKKANLFV